jgi:hypothetical protein
MQPAPRPAPFAAAGSGLQSATGQQGGRALRQGSFYPELTLGAGGLSTGRAAELQQFLVEVIRQRGCPLHVANLWNALYFNYDLEHRGFHAEQLEQKRIPTREAQARAWSLPVGGFVRVRTEMACGDLLAEVIYKEGAHEEVDERDDWISPVLSGAPATATDEVAGQRVSIVRERFVLDINAFGRDGNCITVAQYERLCDRARWLDGHGHLLMEAMYGPEEAELDDLDYYADYLLREHRDGLLAFCFTEELSDEELREALLRSFDAVRQLAIDARELRGWRDKYFFLESDYLARLSDGDGVLGDGDLREIARGLTHIPSALNVTYSAIRPRILELLERGGMSEEEQERVRGAGYVNAVCHANTYVVDTLRRDQRAGVLDSGVHVRLDDDWQGGGVWRAERVDSPERFTLKNVPATIPLGLGHAASKPAVSESEPLDEVEQPIESSQRGFRVALTRRDRELHRLRFSPSAGAALADGPIDVAIRGEDARETVERDGSSLYGITFPLRFHPGIVLYCNVESGGSVVRVHTESVTPPVVASDGKSFDYETNLAVYEREMGLRELTAAQKRDAPSFTELVHRAFRSCGRPRADGSRALTLGELATVILGPAWSPTDTRAIRDAVTEFGLEHDGSEIIWRPRVSRRTRSADRSLLAAYGDTRARGGIERAVRRHFVPMHLRRYTETSGRAPSAKKRASYAEARVEYGMHGVFPEKLPEGYTWVKPYDWGSDGGGELTRTQVDEREAVDQDDADESHKPVGDAV